MRTAGVVFMRQVAAEEFEILQADDEIEVDEVLLGSALAPQVSYGDGILTFRGVNRTVSYGIAGPGSVPHTRRAVRAPDPLEHVLFDGQAEVRGHVCGRCRAIADALPCAEDLVDGTCTHVQYAACDCPGAEMCDVCAGDWMAVPS
jgi:hypothetical protein